MKRKQKSLKYLNRIRDMLSERHCNNISVSFDLEIKLLDVVIDTIELGFVASCGVNGRDPEIGKSNARLIASTPDLLEACIEARSALSILSPKGYVIDKLQQAIAKAEGK